jgi:hypothetical protein
VLGFVETRGLPASSKRKRREKKKTKTIKQNGVGALFSPKTRFILVSRKDHKYIMAQPKLAGTSELTDGKF